MDHFLKSWLRSEIMYLDAEGCSQRCRIVTEDEHMVVQWDRLLEPI